MNDIRSIVYKFPKLGLPPTLPSMYQLQSASPQEGCHLPSPWIGDPWPAVRADTYVDIFGLMGQMCAPSGSLGHPIPPRSVPIVIVAATVLCATRCSDARHTTSISNGEDNPRATRTT